ncbi:hypothetical protein M9Y10_028192 [Tritrichomonas musculus]|uniref:MSP domain-containing protein n=2 Tax=Tritrichomonas musculus TaxID=1915356 RepID=A0ABR2KLY6_9EUKA
MMCLNLQMHSFEFFNGLVGSNDTIRVSITTLPDGQKKAMTFDTKKIYAVHPSFTVNFSEITEKIVIVFRRKSMLSNDHIIASTVINSDEFPQLFKDAESIEMRRINIYEPVQHMSKENKKVAKNLYDRKIVGKMEIQLSLCERFERQNNNLNNQLYSKNNNKQFPKMNSLLNNNKDDSNLLFRDLISN